jgi:hypothetical protein
MCQRPLRPPRSIADLQVYLARFQEVMVAVKILLDPTFENMEAAADVALSLSNPVLLNLQTVRTACVAAATWGKQLAPPSSHLKCTVSKRKYDHGPAAFPDQRARTPAPSSPLANPTDEPLQQGRNRSWLLATKHPPYHSRPMSPPGSVDLKAL